MFSFAAERWMSSPLSKEKETFNFKFKFMKNYHFKGTLPKYTDIHDVLELLEQTTNIKFEIKGNTVIVMQDLTRANH